MIRAQDDRSAKRPVAGGQRVLSQSEENELARRRKIARRERLTRSLQKIRAQLLSESKKVSNAKFDKLLRHFDAATAEQKALDKELGLS